MRSPHKDRASSVGRGPVGDIDHAGELIASPNKPTRGCGQLIDKYGHVHSESILDNWSPQALKVMGVVRRFEVPRRRR
jgi:hypothetical protein